MDDKFVTRIEHDELHGEFCKRIEAENDRQNRRIELLEEEMKQVADIVSSVKELTQSLKYMTDIQKEQEKKIAKLENRDGEMWRKVTSYIIITIIGIVIGFTFQQFGM